MFQSLSFILVVILFLFLLLFFLIYIFYGLGENRVKHLHLEEEVNISFSRSQLRTAGGLSGPQGAEKPGWQPELDLDTWVEEHQCGSWSTNRQRLSVLTGEERGREVKGKIASEKN